MIKEHIIARVLVRRCASAGHDGIEVITRGGLSGYGEGPWSEQILLKKPEALVGRSVFEVEAIFEEFGAAGLDLALWDAAARTAEMPASRMLGKVYRDSVRQTSRLPEGFIEEPYPAADLHAYRLLKETSPIPVAAGRTFPFDSLLRDFVQQELVDVAIPELTRWGLTGLRRLAYFCWTFRVRLGVACSGSPLSTAAAIHAAACFVPATRAIAAPAPFILSPKGEADVGVPEGPGLGVVPEFAGRTADVVIGD